MGTSGSGSTADVSDAITADTLGIVSGTKIVTATSKDTSVAEVTNVVKESADVAADAVNIGQVAVAASTNASAGTYIKSFKITAVGAGSTYIDVKIIDTATSTESHKYIPVKVSSEKKLASKTAAAIKSEVTDKNPAENEGGATYKVTMEPMENGSVTATPSAGVAEGAEVTLEIKPETGYALDTLTVDGADKTADVAEGKYTFTMPGHDVKVSAAFKSKSIYSTGLVGDIVLSDGKYITAENYTKYKSIVDASNETAVAVIFFKDADKKLGVGLKQGTNLAWAPFRTTGYSTEFDTSEENGNGNWEVIKVADSTGAANAATNYPAFNFANTYGVSVAGEESGWYIPAKDELQNLCDSYRASGSAVKEALAKCTGTIDLSTGRFWSSSQYASSSNYLVWTVHFGSGNLDNYTKSSTDLYVCAVRAFN